MPVYFNILECGSNILDILDVTYEQACMATTKYIYYEKFLKTLLDDNNRNGAPFSNENQHIHGKTEAEIERNINEITMNTSFLSPAQKRDISKINDFGFNEPDNKVGKISDSNE